MWPRVVEIMFGCWLLLSPFIFHYTDADARWWVSDYVCAALVITLAGLSFHRRLGSAHLLTLGVAAWLVGFGYFGARYPAPPAAQNSFVLGLMLLMFAVIPNISYLPPAEWRDYLEAELEPAAEK